jgi:hypothetical protein
MAEVEHWNSIARWAAEYCTVAAAAKPTREQMLAAARGMGVRQRQRFVIGLIPEPPWPVPADLQAGLADLKSRIEQRVKDRLAEAIRANPSWLAALGPIPAEARARAGWHAAAVTVAAYRDMYGVDSDQPLGRLPDNPAQRIDHARARHALADLRGSLVPAYLAAAVLARPSRHRCV